MASSGASSSHSINKDMKSRQSDKVSIYIQGGVSLKKINGVIEYVTLGLPKRILHLPSPIIHSTLVMCVAEKLCLTSAFGLFYKNPLSDEIFELGDDDDVQLFENVYQITSQTLTLLVVNHDGGYHSTALIDLPTETRDGNRAMFNRLMDKGKKKMGDANRYDSDETTQNDHDIHILDVFKDMHLLSDGEHEEYVSEDEFSEEEDFVEPEEGEFIQVQQQSTHVNINGIHNVHGKDSIDIKPYIQLDRAIMSGNWELAEVIFNIDKDALTAKIDSAENSPLHIAIGTPHLHFVKNLLEMINPELLPTMVNRDKWTVLHNAALFGNLEAAKMLVEKHPHLLFITDIKGNLPIHKAIINFHMKTFDYLLEESKNKIDELSQEGECMKSPFKGDQGFQLITNVISAGELDVAYNLIQKFPSMATTKLGKQSPLNCIASMRGAYFSGTQYNFYQRFLYYVIPIKNRGIDDADTIKDIEKQERDMAKCRRNYFYPAIQRIYAKFWELAQHVPHIKKISQERTKHNAAVMLLDCICKAVSELNVHYYLILEHYYDGFNLAVQNDTSEAIEVIIRYFPQATWIKSNEGYKLSQNAIINRSEKVYNFFVEKVVNNHMLKTCIYEGNNNLLHLVAKQAPIHKPNKVTGAALQIQRELQWFKEVERFVFPSDKEQKNEKGDIPMMVFRKNHEGLRKDGEEWMKKTADSYTITAALIITIAFAAAITVPGGNNGDTGKAIFERQASFIVFVASDAISLFTSSTSLLLFLSVLTARYEEEDFLYSLPTRLILGLVMLFLSVTCMIVAFSATLYLLFGQENSWILIPIGVLTCLPIASFITLQFPLLVDLILSTYGRGIFSKKRNYHTIKLHRLMA